MSVSKPSYPAARHAPETVTFGGGVSYQDPFHWMEEDNAEALSWQSEQDALSETLLKKLPTYDAFARKVQAFDAGHAVNIPKFAGGRWFRQYTPEGQDLVVVEVSDTPEGPGRRVIDLNAMRRDEPLQLEHYRPSPDGRKILFGWNVGGREGGLVQVIDVDTGALVLESLPQQRIYWAAWLPDSSGFYYQGYDPAVSMTQAAMFLHKLGEAPATKAEDLARTDPVIWPVVSADGRHAMILADHLCPRPEYIRELGAPDGWRPFLRGVDGMFRGVILGDAFIAITNDGAPRGRLVSIPLATPQDRATWRELVPGSDAMLGSVLVVGNRIVLMDLIDTYSRIRVLDAGGKVEREIALPGRGVVNSFGGVFALFCMLDPITAAGPDEIIYLFNSPTQDAVICIANVATGVVRQVTEPASTLAAVVTDGVGVSADGEKIPYRIVTRSDLDPLQPRPTVIFGYGGFNAAMLPGWIGAMWAAWVEAGGNLVIAHLRGGGEFGPDWWTEGRMKHKQNSFNDVYAVAEDLIARGIATPQTLGVNGGSNGGVMASVCAVQRPDLFAASVPQVPITDVLGRRRDPITMSASLDYGDPDDAELAPVINAWSPYQNIEDGVAYPAVLIDSGLNDPRCPAWHGRKFIARMQEANTSDRPILLRVRSGAGHGTVGTASAIEQQAEVLSFFADQLGLDVK